VVLLGEFDCALPLASLTMTNIRQVTLDGSYFIKFKSNKAISQQARIYGALLVRSKDLFMVAGSFSVYGNLVPTLRSPIVPGFWD
jgi:hypothetical protein